MSETSGGTPDLQGASGKPFQDEGGAQQLFPPASHCHPMSVFLTPQYRNLSLFGVTAEEDAQIHAEVVQQIKAQRAVEKFINDGCLLRAATTSVGGGLLGKPHRRECRSYLASRADGSGSRTSPAETLAGPPGPASKGLLTSEL